MVYPDYKLMQSNKLVKLKETQGKCEVCGLQADQIHHIDGTFYNHSLGNLIILCNKCHSVLHYKTYRKYSKLSKVYGLTIKELSDKYGRKPPFFYYLHRTNQLADYLKNPNNFNDNSYKERLPLWKREPYKNSKKNT